MQSILAALRYNLRNLTRFSGRDRRGLFWPWAIFLFVMMQLVGLLAAIPVMMRATGAAMEQAARTPAGTRADPAELVQRMDLASTMQEIVVVTSLVTLLVVLLLAAAVVRRLHDTAWAGWWALLPLPFLVAGLALFPSATGQFEAGRQADPSQLMALAANNLLYWIALIFLVFLLARKGTPGPNRYGEQPPQAGN